MSRIFEGKIAAISGGLGDIGRATAISFAQKGAHVAICDIQSPYEAKDWLNTMKSLGVEARYHQVDVSRSDEVHNWLESVEQELGTPSLIVANAATATMKDMNRITTREWDREIQVNLNGTFYMVQDASRRLVKQEKSGRIVLVGSWAGHVVHSHIPAYSVSKAAVRMLCKCLALELAPHGILVNEVAPGFVDAGLSGRIWAKQPGLKEESLRRVPIQKIMSPKAVAEQIIYLCHPDNDQMTGSTLLMDGGLSLNASFE